jgi:CO/xanthine dehydrogenase Mo-binding subunit
MNPSQVKALLEAQGAQAEPIHLAAAAAIVTALLKATAERFAKLPLEAEPSDFQAEQRRNAP